MYIVLWRSKIPNTRRLSINTTQFLLQIDEIYQDLTAEVLGECRILYAIRK